MNKVTFEKKLAEWCEPVKGSDIYFRPFLTKDVPSENGIFIVGINPATAILRSKKLPMEEYAASLHNNYEKFEEIYNKEPSPTRIGIDGFVKFLKCKLEKTGNPQTSIFETDMNAYPTKNKAELEKLEEKEPETFKRGQEIFSEVFEFFRPKILILHSAAVVHDFRANFGNKFKAERNCDLSENFKIRFKNFLETLENPLYTIPLGKNETCGVFACRHLHRYHSTGDTYEDFKKNIFEYVKKVF